VSSRPLRRLYAAAFASTFDRFATPPLLAAIAATYGVPVGEAVSAASAYFLLYGLSQPLWALLSDRIGRVRVMRLALVAGGLLGAVAAAAPALWLLAALRGATGALLGAVVPATLVHLGDVVGEDRARQRALGDVVGANGAATGLATVLAGLAAELVSWRLAFVGSGLLAVAAGLAVGRLGEAPLPPRRGPLEAYRAVLRSPWAVAVVGLALVEGAIIFGGITFLPAAVEAAGSSPAVAGLALAAFGAGSVAWTRLLGRATRRLGAPALVVLGAGLAAGGFAVAAAEPAVGGVVVAAALVAGGYGFMHTTLQTWATAVLPGLRASVVALFAAGLFCGAGVGAELLAPLADAGDFDALFAVLAAAVVPLGAVAALARRAWRPPPPSAGR